MHQWLKDLNHYLLKWMSSLQSQGRRKVKVLVGDRKWGAQPSSLIKNYIKLVGELWISISNEVTRKWVASDFWYAAYVHCDLATHIIICPFLTFFFWKMISALFFFVCILSFISIAWFFLWFMQSKCHGVCAWEEKGCANILYLTEEKKKMNISNRKP